MLKLGISKSWPYALEQMTGSQEMSVAPIKEYFQPLQKWLEKERCSKNYKIGWPGQSADGVEKCDTSSSSASSTTSAQTLWAIAAAISLIQLFG